MTASLHFPVKCRKWSILFPIIVITAIWCGGLLAKTAGEPLLKLIKSIPHSGYSEGLTHHEGYLWHALPKEILKIDPKDGSVLERFKPASAYSESLVWLKGKLWNLSFDNNGIYQGELQGKALLFQKKGETPEVHGWGLATDGKHLIMTGEYSTKLYFVDPATLKVVKVISTDVSALEDLAWDGRRIWTSSFTELKGHIFSLDPKTGKRIQTYRLPDADNCPIIDGIAFDGKTLWVTGKHCPKIYQFELPK